MQGILFEAAHLLRHHVRIGPDHCDSHVGLLFELVLVGCRVQLGEVQPPVVLLNIYILGCTRLAAHYFNIYILLKYIICYYSL